MFESLHWLILPTFSIGVLLLLGTWIADNAALSLLFGSRILLVLAVLMPVGTPWLILLPFALASSSRRTSLLAQLLAVGSLLAYYLLLVSSRWSGQALVTVGLPMLIWSWVLFSLSTWEMTHYKEEEAESALTPRTHKRLGASISRPSWPSRSGLRGR